MESTVVSKINHLLDGWVHPEIKLGHLSIHTFRLAGLLGFYLAVILAGLLVIRRGQPLWVMGAVISAVVATFFSLAMVTKLLTGREKLVYYHHEIAVIAVSALLLKLLRQPLLIYLDATILGVGLFLAFGRIGCLMAGCCHGLPSDWGVCYSQRHTNLGFSPHYLGVRLLPVQAIESLWVFLNVCLGASFVFADFPPGVALTWYLVSYGLERFVIEFLRGDAERAYWLGFSEAQWISLILVSCTAIVEWSAPGSVIWRFIRLLHGMVALGLWLSLLGIAWQRRMRGQEYRLLLPGHLQEIAGIFRQFSLLQTQAGTTGSPTTAQNLPVAQTSLGLLISARRIHSSDSRVDLYSLSCRAGHLSEPAASALARVLLKLHWGPNRKAELVCGEQSIFHLVVRYEQLE